MHLVADNLGFVTDSTATSTLLAASGVTQADESSLNVANSWTTADNLTDDRVIPTKLGWRALQHQHESHRHRPGPRGAIGAGPVLGNPLGKALMVKLCTRPWPNWKVRPSESTQQDRQMQRLRG